jgi:hypothetical protein
MHQGTEAIHSRPRRLFPSLFGLIGWLVFASWAYLIVFFLAANVNRPLPIWDIWLMVYACSSMLAFWGSILWLPFAIVFVVSRGFRAGTKAERIELFALPMVIVVCALVVFLLAD